MSYKENGYVVVHDFLQASEVQDYRNILDSYLLSNNSCNETGNSRLIPGFAGRIPELQSLNRLHNNDMLHDILGLIFQTDDFIFLNHSDIHQNKTTGWHRDTMDYERGGGLIKDTWNDDYFIVKACFLLQDHIDNEYGLWFKPGTHRKGINTKPIHVNSKSTDLIIFDQRILHRGQVNCPPYDTVYGKNRYLITYGYGIDNKHSTFHKLGATKRQQQQQNQAKIKLEQQEVVDTTDMKDYWEKCDTTFAHITIDKWLSNYKKLTSVWQKMFIDQLLQFTELTDKIIIDYGIGGGYLGVYLHKKYNICKYIGIDIAQRSLDYAYKNLQDNRVDNELYLAPVQFETFNADIFVCQAVIQHFPDESYLQNFLSNINQSKIKYIMLQIRFGEKTLCNNDKYSNNISIESVVHKCFTNNLYILNFLQNYDNVYEGGVQNNGYQFLIYQLKE